MNKPLAILFDLGDTLLCGLKFDPIAGNARLLEFAEDAGEIGPQDIQRIADELDAEIRPIRDTGPVEFPVQNFQRLLFDTLNIKFRISPVDMELEFWKGAVRYEPEPRISDILTDLKSYNIKLGVVSNNAFSGPILEWELAQHNLLDFFDFVLSSADYGIRKPHPLIFSTAVSKLGVRPSEVWFCGDKQQFDVTGAKDAGLWAIWYNRQKSNDDGVQPHVEIHNWPELIDLAQKYIG